VIIFRDTSDTSVAFAFFFLPILSFTFLSVLPCLSISQHCKMGGDLYLIDLVMYDILGVALVGGKLICSTYFCFD
jgi:hypothetical protein